MPPRWSCFSISSLAAGALALQSGPEPTSLNSFDAYMTGPEPISLNAYEAYLTMPLANIHDQHMKSNFGWKSVHSAREQVQIYTDGQGYRQELRNEYDVQYMGMFSVAGQPLVGIFDTGSYDVVVFTKECDTCGKGVRYDARLSSLLGSRTVVGGAQSWKYYNSGALLAEETFSDMSLGPWKSFKQSLSEVSLARMPNLKYSDFDAIIGIGPPESRARAAWEMVGRAAQKASAALDEGNYSESIAVDVRDAVDKAKLAGNYSTVLRTVNESMFSICLGKDKLSKGYLIWNDTSVALHPELFHRVPVATSHSWKVQVRNIRLSYLMNSSKSDIKLVQPDVVPDMDTPRMYQSDEEEYMVFDNSSLLQQQLDCYREGGCLALLDTGSSMLTMPMGVVNKLRTVFETQHRDCGKMLELPHLVFELNGKTFSLAPDAYVGESQADSCQVLVDADISRDDQWIFGLPFFRKYYTTFQVGKGQHHRAVHFAGASEQCTPIKSRVQVHDGPPELWRRTVPTEENAVRFIRWGGLDEAMSM